MYELCILVRHVTILTYCSHEIWSCIGDMWNLQFVFCIGDQIYVCNVNVKFTINIEHLIFECKPYCKPYFQQFSSAWWRQEYWMLLVACSVIRQLLYPWSNGLTLEWRYNGWYCVSKHQPHHRLLNRLFWHWTKKTSKLRVTGLWAGIHWWPVNSPHKWPVKRKIFPFDDVFMKFQRQYISQLMCLHCILHILHSIFCFVLWISWPRLKFITGSVIVDLILY